MAIGLGLAAAVGVLWAASARAAGRPEAPRPAPLRLDDSPALPLLEPFRHASEIAPASAKRYLASRWGIWALRPWCALSPAAADPDAERAGPGDDDPWLRRQIEPASGWPHAVGAEHWFDAGPIDPSNERPLGAAPAFDVEDVWLPPWLRRLDGNWAGELLGSLGCMPAGSCSPGASFPAFAFERLWVALAPQARPVPEWKCREREVTIRRFGREHDSFELVRCDGSMAPEALDRLSLLARPVGVPRPPGALPDEPALDARGGEWVPQIRMLHPRVVWLLHAVAERFPWRSIYVYSGYRRPGAAPHPSMHRSRHEWGRALDISVQGVDNEELLDHCRSLPDVSCGFYPNRRFMHLDVRPRGSGEVLWIDASRPGESARYVDAWPGVAARIRSRGFGTAGNDGSPSRPRSRLTSCHSQVLSPVFLQISGSLSLLPAQQPGRAGSPQ
ncbi:MAG: DUF882 domain-containing protein, partial [Deltaproteobacteria bacterium]|nr:DUF882 domain-containing protein [Deltaproteobacteria bacterium]